MFRAGRSRQCCCYYCGASYGVELSQMENRFFGPWAKITTVHTHSTQWFSLCSRTCRKSDEGGGVQKLGKTKQVKNVGTFISFLFVAVWFLRSVSVALVIDIDLSYVESIIPAPSGCFGDWRKANEYIGGIAHTLGAQNVFRHRLSSRIERTCVVFYSLFLYSLRLSAKIEQKKICGWQQRKLFFRSYLVPCSGNNNNWKVGNGEMNPSRRTGK